MRAILAFLLLFNFAANAQSSLGISKVTLNFPDSATFGDSATFTCWIKNQGPSAFSGTIYVKFGISDTSGLQVTVKDSSLVTLAAYDSIPVSIEETFSQNRYRAGTNVVVIWPQPASGPATVTDSLTKTIYIWPAGIDDVVAEKLFLYPNPATDVVFVGSHFTDIEVYNLSGRLVFKSEKINRINIATLSPGAYLIRARSNKGDYSRARFIKNN